MIAVEKINSWLIIALFFSFSISTASGSIISALVFALWILHANFRNQFLQLRSNRVVVASLLFLIINIAGVAWSSDVSSGWDVVLKNWKFLMLPIFMLYVREEHIRIYINAFLVSIIFSMFLSYLVWFEIVGEIFKASYSNPTVFMSHVVYNPLLAIAIYIVASRLLFEKKKSIIMALMGYLLLFAMIFNIFITGGRAGHILFFVSIFLIGFQYYKNSFFKFLVTSLIVSTAIFATAYSLSDFFKKRVDATMQGIQTFNTNQSSSVGDRLNFAINGFEVFFDNPFFGVGTGDLKSEMKKVHLINTPEMKAPDNLHNNHLMVAVRLGLLGLLSFYWIFYSQIMSSKNITNKELSRLGFVIPIMYFVASFGESYLSSHVMALFFSLISAVVYKKYN